MKKYFIPVLFLVLAGIMVAGCTMGSPGGQSATVTPVPSTGVQETTGVSTLTQPTLAIGDHYLQKSYPFYSESDQFTEQFRIDNPSWAVMFTVLPLNDDPQYCWFEMTVTNLDSQKSQTYGFGRTYPYTTYQQYPMYTTGLYKIEMKGNLVKMDLDVAKRLP
ncbi:hypothetical protein [Methanoregula sp.]|jgi:hypothetical protein|uniref:hypothetical protein n=1 Tax=Methanoregula sp. TaxID=2052170 RepID=UPI0025F22CE0|nr:hypothetical protein [Methanoregula sp.]